MTESFLQKYEFVLSVFFLGKLYFVLEVFCRQQKNSWSIEKINNHTVTKKVVLRKRYCTCYIVKKLYHKKVYYILAGFDISTNL